MSPRANPHEVGLWFLDPIPVHGLPRGVVCVLRRVDGIPEVLRNLSAVGGVVRFSCCGLSWVGVDRAHCCRRTGGCGAVFDDAELWDSHRRHGRCSAAPIDLGLVQTKNGVWIRPQDAA
ncbi:hypothetical protein Ae707Ps1_6185c [Pseudonocardia sp. Ae707_Ps1]|nr:hypothetical protein Ae707Ps1_6185c [Pseudonocardia sp. Ae707_Ps1]